MNGPKPGEKNGRHCDSGPPWTVRTTGNGPLPLRLEQEDGDLLAVEAGEAVQLGIDAVDGPLAGEPAHLARLHVVEVGLDRLARGREREGELGAVAGEDRQEDDAAAGQGHLGAQLQRVRVAQLEARPSVLVPVDEQRAPALVDRALEIPVRVEDDAPLAGLEVVARERAELAERVRRGEQPGRVGQPARRHVLRRALVRSRVGDLARLDVEQEEIGVPGQLAEPLDHEPPAVGRERVHRQIPPQVERPLLPVREPAHDDLEVAAVAAVRRVREQRAVARDDRRPVVEARIDDERLEVSSPLQQVELRPLVPTLIDQYEKAPIGQRLAVDRLGQVGELLHLVPVRGAEKELSRPGEVGCDQQGRPVRREAERPRVRELEERSQIGHEPGRRPSRSRG